jgi:hypothetical protein
MTTNASILGSYELLLKAVATFGVKLKTFPYISLSKKNVAVLTCIPISY